MKDCVQCLHDISAGWFLGKTVFNHVRISAVPRNSLGVVLPWGCRAATGLYIPTGTVQGQGQSTVNLPNSVNAAEESNAVLLSCLPAPMIEGEYPHPAVSPLLGISEAWWFCDKLTKMSLTFC